MNKSDQQGYCPIQAELFIPFLSPPWSCFSSAMLLSSLLLGLGLTSSLHACCSLLVLLELSLLALLLFFQRSGLRSLPLSSLSCWFSVTFKPAICTLFASLPTSGSAPSSIHVRRSSGVMLSMRNKMAQPCFFCRTCPLCSIQTDGHTDKRTHGQTNFR